MDQDGQAPEAPNTIDDVAAFIVDNDVMNDEGPLDEDNPEIESSDEEEAGPDGEEDEDSEEDDPEAEPKPEQTSQKHKVTVKGEDGADEEVEVTLSELKDGYKRHAHYTQSMMALADRERQAADGMRSEVVKAREHYVQQTETTLNAVYGLLGLRSEAEMHQLAVQNPSEWAQERQRKDYVLGVLNQANSQVQQERMRTQQEQQQYMQNIASDSWKQLGEKGIDRKALEGIFTDFSKHYRLNMQDVATVTNPVVIMAMKDAVAFRELKDKAKSAKAAPAKGKIPANRQSVPQQTQQSKRVDARFKSGKANLKDLATLFM